MIPPYIFARHLNKKEESFGKLADGWVFQNSQFYVLKEEQGTCFVFVENENGSVWINTPEIQWPKYLQLPAGISINDILDEIRDRHSSPMKILSDVLR